MDVSGREGLCLISLRQSPAAELALEGHCRIGCTVCRWECKVHASWSCTCIHTHSVHMSHMAFGRHYRPVRKTDSVYFAAVSRELAISVSSDGRARTRLERAASPGVRVHDRRRLHPAAADLAIVSSCCYFQALWVELQKMKGR